MILTIVSFTIVEEINLWSVIRLVKRKIVKGTENIWHTEGSFSREDFIYIIRQGKVK